MALNADSQLGAEVTAFLALGSNLGDREALLVEATRAIASMPLTTLTATSSLYCSPAWGSASAQPDYLNAVLSVRTSLSAQALHEKTATIERAFGRVRTDEKNAARTLDIDLLLYGNLRINTPTLTIPHPRMQARDFVLLPLLEIAPEAHIEGLGSARELLHRLGPTTITRHSDRLQWT